MPISYLQSESYYKNNDILQTKQIRVKLLSQRKLYHTDIVGRLDFYTKRYNGTIKSIKTTNSQKRKQFFFRFFLIYFYIRYIERFNIQDW